MSVDVGRADEWVASTVGALSDAAREPATREPALSAEKREDGPLSFSTAAPNGPMNAKEDEI